VIESLEGTPVVRTGGELPWKLLTDEVDRALLRAYFKGIDAGFWGNLAWKPAMVRGLPAWQRTVTCPP
jgi:hypothetical protein